MCKPNNKNKISIRFLIIKMLHFGSVKYTIMKAYLLFACCTPTLLAFVFWLFVMTAGCTWKLKSGDTTVAYSSWVPSALYAAPVSLKSKSSMGAWGWCPDEPDNVEACEIPFAASLPKLPRILGRNMAIITDLKICPMMNIGNNSFFKPNAKNPSPKPVRNELFPVTENTHCMHKYNLKGKSMISSVLTSITVKKVKNYFRRA